MLNGLRKGTETVKEKSKLNFIEHVCPICNRIFKTKNYNSHKYCSLQCANIDNVNNIKGKVINSNFNSPFHNQ